MKFAQTKIVIFGGDGFVGGELLRSLMAYDFKEIIIVSRREKNAIAPTRNIKFRQVNFDNHLNVAEVIPFGALVINLIYAGDAKHENIRIARTLALAGKTRLIRQFIHLSTASVVGRTKSLIIDESTIPHPFTEYEKIKFEIENTLRGEFENSGIPLLVLRPTAIFGTGGKNIVKLFLEVERGSAFTNYIRSCINWGRNANLVSVEKVVGTIIFFMAPERRGMSGCFIVSSDDDPANQFGEIERRIRRYLRCERRVIPIIKIPKWVVVLLLYIKGLSDFRGCRVYSDARLRAVGYIEDQGLFVARLDSTIAEFDKKFLQDSSKKVR